MAVGSSENNSKAQAEGGQGADTGTTEQESVRLKDWFLLPVKNQVTLLWHEEYSPQIELHAARPPAVKHWAEFRCQAEACFDSHPWSSDSKPLSTFFQLKDDRATSILMLLISGVAGTKFGTLRSTMLPDNGTKRACAFRLGNHGGIAVTLFRLAEQRELNSLEIQGGSLLTSKTTTQRLVERIYGNMVWAGVPSGLYITEKSCTFAYVDANNGNLLVSPSIRHDAKDFTAKQGLLFMFSLAERQVKFDMLAHLGPRKPVRALDNNFTKLFRGLDNMQVISVDDIRLGKILGAGNAAQVYEAHIQGVPVAVKLAHVAGPYDQPWRSMPCADRLVIEIETYEALKSLQGNVIPRVVAYGLIENRAGDLLPFLAMEKVDGKTLEDAFKSMSEEELSGVFKAVMIAYKQLHAAGYTQGSVKPPNVMLCKDGRAVIIDFGRGTSSYHNYEENEVHSMLVGLLADRLGSRSEARQKIEQWKEESRKGEETSCTASVGTTSRSNSKTFAGEPCQRSSDERNEWILFDAAIDEVLEDSNCWQLCWCEGGGKKVPVVARMKGKRVAVDSYRQATGNWHQRTV